MLRHNSFTSNTGIIAKERLIQIILSEHTECSQETLEYMKNDISRVIAKYLPVENGQVSLYLKHDYDRTILFTLTNIQLTR